MILKTVFRFALNGSYISVDGTDCRIMEPTPFSPMWYSHKFKGPGIRYEVGVSIQTSDIVWVHGGFPCGSHPDVRIFRSGLKRMLRVNERVVADKGYTDEKCVTPRQLSSARRSFYALLRARHETVNERLKHFTVLRERFRHDRAKHSICFHAVANVVQVMMRTDPLFSIDM